MMEEQQSNYPNRAADIVIIGSVVGRHVSPFSAVYGATKFAVHSLAEGLRREVGPKGIRVSLVEPGIVVSGFQDAAGYSDDLVRNFDDKFGPCVTRGRCGKRNSLYCYSAASCSHQRHHCASNASGLSLITVSTKVNNARNV